jgi:threonine/homoserine/homoserine lactone efflux protein
MVSETFGLLALFAASMTFSPGPANLTLLGTSIHLGIRRTLPMLIGVISGFLLTAILVCVGLGQLFQLFPSLLSVIKILGCSYILYLAYGLWMARGQELTHKLSANPGFMTGLWVHPLNPKAWMMLISAYSQFVASETLVSDSLVLISVFLLSAMLANSLWTLIGSWLHRYLQYPHIRYWLFSTLAFSMVLLAVVLWLN